MKKFTTFSTIFAFLLFFSTSLLAQVGTGKLAGKVVDAETGEPLIGANIVVENTMLGAATDLDGRYFILNITPGTYNVKFSFIGYSSKTIQDVRVVAGITYELNVTLSAGIEMEEIVISDKKFFEEKSTNTVKVVDASQINQLPVKGVEKIVSLQAGVVSQEGSGGNDGNATINVRGGRGGEVLYIVDGVPQNDTYFGGNFAQVSNAAIDQISFQIGGFEAKYGQAQSGVVNVTTKSGSPKYNLFGDVLTSEFTDDYGYNLYTASLEGPIIPGNANHTFFFSGERGYFLDNDPRAVSVEIPSVGLSSNVKPNTSSGLYRFTGRTIHNLNPFTLRLGANINLRDRHDYVHTYAKANSAHNPRRIDENYSYSARLSQNISSSAFWNVVVGYKTYLREEGDGVLFDDIEAYGDPALNNELFNEDGSAIPVGSRVGLDPLSSFYKKGRVSNLYAKADNKTLNLDLDLTSQMDNHLLEIGGGVSYNILRRYSLAPAKVAENKDLYTYEERLALQQPFLFGYDVFGNESNSDVTKTIEGFELPISVKPKNPLISYLYVQDRYELDDLVINVGVRFDYFDSQQDVLRNEALPFAYGDPNIFDPADFKLKDPEFYVSPRIGIGFPVTESTVFHAQYGKFVQQPNLTDIVTTVSTLNSLTYDANFGVNTGNVDSEITTQYEVGFRQVLGDNLAALNITAFYKNIVGLINDETIFFQRVDGGARDRYYRPTNSDFGTIKGLALSLTVANISYVSLNLDYTYSLAEGTGSSTGSSTTAAFRNNNGETPKVIAPLDFDQRHTGVVNLNFYVPEGELGFLEMMSLNVLFSFNSGRPYTPLVQQDIQPGGASNLGDTKGYVNSAYAPGSNRIDLKLEKSFPLFESMRITPYLWVENLLDSDNPVTVYRSTGSPYTTGFLNTKEGSAKAAQVEGYTEDYKALERDPFNFGIPRLIKLGFRINFSNIGG